MIVQGERACRKEALKLGRGERGEGKEKMMWKW
jgi:hypothetical protein